MRAAQRWAAGGRVGALAVLALWLCLAPLAWAAEPLSIAVLAYRPKPQTLAQWQPLQDELRRTLPDLDFRVQAYTLDELGPLVASHGVDFVLTNSGHYVWLVRTAGLRAPLATLLVDESGHETSSFGGVVFTRADRSDVQRLQDLRGRKLAAVSAHSLGGYQMQAYELLQRGIDLQSDVQMHWTGMPQDRVVQAVLDGQSDAGFVRTGVIEQLVREHKLDPSRVRVLDSQVLAEFPVAVSTALYPEWPFASLAHVDERLVRRVAAALFLIEANSAAARAMGIRGFSVPADYTPVADLLRALRQPPFDQLPQFTWRDVAQRYRSPLLLAGLTLGAILALSLWLVWTRRQLRQRSAELLRERADLQREVLARQESESRTALSRNLLQLVIENIPLRVFWKDPDLRYLGSNAAFARDAGLSQAVDLIGRNDFELSWHEMAPAYRADDQAVIDHALPRLDYEERQPTPSGQWMWLRTSKVPMLDAQGACVGVLGVYEDITARRAEQQQLKLAASVFRYAREGIMITDPQGAIVDVNTAFGWITGYSRDEVIGRNPRLLNAGVQDEAFYARMFATLATQDHWSGEMWNRRKDGAVFAEKLTISAIRDAAGQLTHYVAMFFDITAMKEQQHHLEQAAHFDALTGLPNRVLLGDRLRHAMVQTQRRGALLAVAYLDLDGFKAVNDTHGHAMGDQLLVTLTRRMKSSLREADTLSRLGGDEFVAVLTDLADASDCVATLGRLLEAAAQPVDVQGVRLQVSASIGVTFYPQVEAIEADQLLRQADQAMYQAKLGGRNRYHVFDAAQDRSVRGLNQSLDEFEAALQRGEFVLYYQPKVNLRSGAVVGVEALIRWLHPERGLLAPGQFLPLIEDHALAVRLGDWVIQAACAQWRRWASAGVAVPISVNVSARQLESADFVDKLAAALHTQDGPAPQIQAEVLETSALEDVERMALTIARCTSLGVGFALDDFGTGYSSLTYLKHLPVELIKIDQSFVRDMLTDVDDLAILQAIVGLARAFNRAVIAEGVESLEHARRLLDLGCELAQGYGIARPMPAADWPAWLAQWPRRADWQTLAHAQI